MSRPTRARVPSNGCSWRLPPRSLRHRSFSPAGSGCELALGRECSAGTPRDDVPHASIPTGMQGPGKDDFRDRNASGGIEPLQVPMTRRPGDSQHEPPGGRAAERQREFLEQRFGTSSGEKGVDETPPEEEEDEEQEDPAPE